MESNVTSFAVLGVRLSVRNLMLSVDDAVAIVVVGKTFRIFIFLTELLGYPWKNGSQVRSIMGHVLLQRALITTKEKVFPEALSLAYIYTHASVVCSNEGQRLYFQGEIIHPNINRTLATFKSISPDQIKIFLQKLLESILWVQGIQIYLSIELPFPDSNSEQNVLCVYKNG